MKRQTPSLTVLRRSLSLAALLLASIAFTGCVPDAGKYDFACLSSSECGSGWECIRTDGTEGPGSCAKSTNVTPCKGTDPKRCLGYCCPTGQMCVESQIPGGGTKEACCTLDIETKCYNGEDIYWFDSCGNKGALVTTCPDGCDGHTNKCIACTANCSFPDGSTKECGSDGCGGGCGVCGGDGVCQSSLCQCSHQKCEGLCCAEGHGCHAETGACCLPDDPGGKGCLDGDIYILDGCGQQIAIAEECDFGCEADASFCNGCVPECDGKNCGDDGCGGNCGACENPCDGNPFDDTLCMDGVCATPCCPDCDGKYCGDDGCDGICGECEDGFSCFVDQCVESGCTVESCATEGKLCDPDTTICVDCLTEGDCAEDETCTDGACVVACVPDCEGKDCGDDGCGDSCGSCGEDYVCDDEGACVSTCVIDCEGKECGGDGCGGECGACSGDSVCNPDYQCADPLSCPELLGCLFLCEGDEPCEATCHAKTFGETSEALASLDACMATASCASKTGAYDYLTCGSTECGAAFGACGGGTNLCPAARACWQDSCEQGDHECALRCGFTADESTAGAFAALYVCVWEACAASLVLENPTLFWTCVETAKTNTCSTEHNTCG